MIPEKEEPQNRTSHSRAVRGYMKEGINEKDTKIRR